MRSTIFDSSENENAAAAVILKTPEMVVASRMESSVELILSLGKMQQSCKLKHSNDFSANANKKRGRRGRVFYQPMFRDIPTAAGLKLKLVPGVHREYLG
jgi:hypothetical protein